ncbi:MAG: hypothetical protein R6V07_05540 [Armatimonadota bacterium]
MRYLRLRGGEVDQRHTVASVKVDASYSACDAEPLNDGIAYPAEDARWPEKAWASAESDGPHWIELCLRGTARHRCGGHLLEP